MSYDKIPTQLNRYENFLNKKEPIALGKPGTHG